jgi:flagellar hook-associated protein 2
VGLSSAGIGSGLDVEGLISKLMAAEAAPLANFDKQSAQLQVRLGALGKLSAAIGAFQGSLSALSNGATFRALSTKSADESILTGSASASAAPGKYNINVTQLAQAQSLNTAGQTSMSAMLGSGATTTLTFQFGSVSSGQFGVAGSALGAAVAANGITNGSLTINGTAIATDAGTTSAKALAAAINTKESTTGVTASAGKSATGAALFGSFGAVDASAGSYALSVNGVQIGAADAADGSGGLGLNPAAIDGALTGSTATTNALAAAGITYSGSAAAGTLQFFSADGANLAVKETVSGAVTGGLAGAGNANTGSSSTATAGVTLSSASASPITLGGSAPAAAGLAAGSAGSYLNAGFTQDGARASGSVTLNAGDQSLTGIRDAINKAKLGVSASIVSDGSATPYHLVITSDSTGASASMKIGVAGDGTNPPDPALAALLGYDPGGTQGLRQTSAAQSSHLNVNGIDVTSDSNNVGEAIQGLTLTVQDLGSTSLTVSRNSQAVTDGVNSFVKAYNDLNKTIASLTSFSADTKSGGPLQGDATVRSIQSTLRRALGTTLDDGGKLTTLSQVGIAFQKDGSLAVDSTKLNKAISDNFGDFGQLFAALGSASDGLVQFSASSAATKPGTYALNVTALATQGSLTSAAPLTGSTVIAPNTTWSVTLNQTDPTTASKTQNIALPAGTYNNTQLAAMLRAAINGNTTFSGAGDVVETAVDAAGKLTLSSSRFGSTSNIALTSLTGSAISDIFGAAAPAVGTDVAGTIGGVAATGSGQTLSAAPGSAAAGMQLAITGGATGDRGTVTFSQGYAYQLNNLAASFIGTSGLITGKSDGINVSIKSVASQKDAFNARLADVEKRFRAQFTALDTMLASMQSTSSYLTQQLAAIAKNSA